MSIIAVLAKIDNGLTSAFIALLYLLVIIDLLIIMVMVVVMAVMSIMAVLAGMVALIITMANGHNGCNIYFGCHGNVCCNYHNGYHTCYCHSNDYNGFDDHNECDGFII